MIPTKASGKALTKVGQQFGVRRRFFGAEPDFMFRRRCIRAVQGFTRARLQEYVGQSITPEMKRSIVDKLFRCLSR